ncbi:acyltransferase family protein [Nitrincola nitratireducens]|uniref:acyltransferase family protein n=1 Tax=Nitrincola nitratireducens TaxID=1229521 RepID=UPI003B50B0FC
MNFSITTGLIETPYFSHTLFCMGYLIKKHNIHNKIDLKYAIMFSTLGLLCLFAESYYNFFNQGREGGFDNYISILLACPFIFITFIKINTNYNSKNIALYSSGIYFIHSIVLTLLKHFTELEPTALTIAGIIISVSSAYFLIKLNRKAKFIL